MIVMMMKKIVMMKAILMMMMMKVILMMKMIVLTVIMLVMLLQVNMKTLTVAMSGAVAAVAHVDGPHLHVASTGDCTAVIGSLSETDTWLANKLTTEHNSDNQREVRKGK